MKTLILGKGLMGSELVKQTTWSWISRDSHGIDITKPVTYEYLLKGIDQVINCTGYTNTRNNVKEPAWSVNYLAVMDLVDVCNDHGIKLVHISTDYIYANSVENASEQDVPIHYNNWYTYTKVLSDAYIQARCENYLMIRASYKPRPFPWEKAWSGLVGNFDYVDVIASILIELINAEACGVYNVGTEVKNMYQLARYTRPGCKMDDNQVMPYNITMNLKKLYSFLEKEHVDE